MLYVQGKQGFESQSGTANPRHELQPVENPVSLTFPVMSPSTNGGSRSASSASQRQNGEAGARMPRTDQELAQVRKGSPFIANLSFFFFFRCFPQLLFSSCLFLPYVVRSRRVYLPFSRASTCRVRPQMIQSRCRISLGSHLVSGSKRSLDIQCPILINNCFLFFLLVFILNVCVVPYR